MVYSGPLRPILIFEAPLSGPPEAGIMPRISTTRDLSDLGGDGKITGSVKVDSTPDYPVWRRVRLFCEHDNRLVGEVWSDPATGAYAFEYINAAMTYTVIAYDHTGAYNGQIRTGVTADPM